MHWRRKWQPTPVFLPGEPRDGGAWWAAVYGVAQSRTQLKQLSSSSRSNHKQHQYGDNRISWGTSQLQIPSHQENFPPKTDCSHPKNSPAHSMRSHRIWMFFLRTVRLSLTWLEVLTRNNMSYLRWLESLLVQGSGALSPINFGVQPLPSCVGSLELSWEILSPET